MRANLFLNSSPVQHCEFEGIKFLVKRDDQLDDFFSGNKARKLYYFLLNNFPKIEKVISYGSVQSNMLLSLSALAKIKGWQLEFYVHNIPKWLEANPIGNYAKAIELGASVIQWSNIYSNNQFTSINDFITNKELNSSSDTLFIPEGGHCEQAKFGIKKLANEIEEYCQKEQIQKLLVMLPSGTGTTALFLNYFLRQSTFNISVMTCACVGDEKYLKKLFFELSSNLRDWPKILFSEKKFHFGKLYQEHYELWLKLKQQTNIEFDLLYDPIGWHCLLNYLKDHNQKHVMYIHQGGLIGNQSMLSRYRRNKK